MDVITNYEAKDNIRILRVPESEIRRYSEILNLIISGFEVHGEKCSALHIKIGEVDIALYS